MPTTRDSQPRVGIVSAMREEMRSLLPHLVTRESVQHFGARSFHVGRIAGTEVVLVLSGIGKVSAAATTAMLLERFGVTSILFTGVAGGLASGVSVGDVVIADELLQHDLDASPLFPRYEVPLSGRSRFACDQAWSERLERAARSHGLKSHRGLIVSGDQFIATAGQSQALRKAIPDALAVEMEGAAVAQVCADFECPFALIRTISDRADDSAHVDFQRFVADVAADVSHRLVMHVLEGARWS